MGTFRKIVAVMLAVCLMPLVASALAEALSWAGGCSAAAPGGGRTCRLGGGVLPSAVTLADRTAELAWVTVPAGLAVLLFWGLAEAARLLGTSRRTSRGD